MRSSSALAAASKTTRSRVTNGSSPFVHDVDGRTKEARRFRDVLAEIVSDLGGPELLSEGQRQLARRAALMSVACETMEAKCVAGEEIDVDTYGALSDRIGRAFHRLGLKRVPKDVTPDLQDYIAARAREAAE